MGKIEQEIKECEDRIELIKHRLAVREQRLQYLQNRHQKILNGEYPHHGKTTE
jgi:hypothetical protein